MDSGVPETEENQALAEISYHGKAGKLRAEKRPGQELAGFSVSLWRGVSPPQKIQGLEGREYLASVRKKCYTIAVYIKDANQPPETGRASRAHGR